jgi:hypothetical protein
VLRIDDEPNFLGKAGEVTFLVPSPYRGEIGMILAPLYCLLVVDTTHEALIAKLKERLLTYSGIVTARSIPPYP